MHSRLLLAAICLGAAAGAHAAHLAFCEDLVSQGRLLPAWRDMAVATLDHFAAQPAVVEFGEGDAPAGAFDDRPADHALDPAHVLTDRRLGHVQHRRRAAAPRR